MHFVPGHCQVSPDYILSSEVSEMRKMLWMVHHVTHGAQGRESCNWSTSYHCHPLMPRYTPDIAAMWLGWTEMPPTSILSFVINSSRFFTCFLSFARLFWNQIFAWREKSGYCWLVINVISSYLSLWECQCLRELCLPPDSDVSAVMELFLQLQSLMITVNNAILVFSPCST